MRNIYFVFVFILFYNLSAFAQFKSVNLKRLDNYDKSINLRAYAIKPPKLQNDIYKLSGKIPGKADFGFLTHDANDKHSFLLLARYWNKQKKMIKDDQYALKFYAREFSPPKGYDGRVVEESFVNDKGGVFYVRKYASAFNEKEQDTIEMVEVTYVATHSKIKKEVIVFDLFMIGDHTEVAPALELAKQFVDQINPLGIYYDKKWNVVTEMNVITGTGVVKTDMAYITKWESNGKARFARADFNPTLATGPSIWGSRHIANNYWARVGVGLYAGTNNNYDSLYNSKEVDLGYFTNPVIYDVVIEKSDFKYVTVGVEKRLFLNGRNSINVYLNFRKSFGENYFQLTAKDWGSNMSNVHRVNYDNPFGFDCGAKYQHCFKYHHWGVNGGIGFSYSTFNFKNYTLNGSQADINSAPYFIPEMKTLNFSGFAMVAGAFYQF